MELQNDINIIHEKLDILSTEIKSRGEFNMLDINVLAETFFAELMNLIFGYQLKNINLFERNAKAIDLIDTENKIIVQVSSDNSKGKVQSSLSGIKEEYKKSKYHFIFISISKAVTNLKKQSFEIPKGIKFDPKNDCYDNKTLITYMVSKVTEGIEGIERIKSVSKYLNETVVYTGPKSVVPDFVFPFEDANNLIARDTAVVKLYNIVKGNRVTNLYGFGGSGKTSLINLFVKKYENEFNQKAYIVVNSNIRDEFIKKINATIQIEGEKKLLTKGKEDIFKSIITYLEDNYKSDKENLLIIDINNAPESDANSFCYDLIHNTEQATKIYPIGWKYLIVSRNQLFEIGNNLNLNENESKNENIEFLKELFLKNVGKQKYKDFDNEYFAELFKKIHYSPLMTEQLGIFLKDDTTKSLAEINEILDKDSFNEQSLNNGVTLHNKKVSEEEKQLIGFLKNIIRFDELKVEEQLLLKHFILWQDDYISEDVIKQLLNRTFKSETNRFTKICSIFKHCFNFKFWQRIGAFYNKTKQFNVKYPQLLSLLPILIIIAVFSEWMPNYWGIYSILLSVSSVLLLFILEYSNFNCIFRPLQRLVIGGAYGLLIKYFLPTTTITNVGIIISTPLFLTFPLLIKKTMSCLLSNKFLGNTKEKNIEKTLSELSKRYISKKEVNKQKSYKLHSLIAESIKLQIDIQHTDYADYWSNINDILFDKNINFVPFAECYIYSSNKLNYFYNFAAILISLKIRKINDAQIKESLYVIIINILIKSNLNFILVFTRAKLFSELAHLQYKQINDYDSALKNLKTTIDIIESFPKWITQLFFVDDYLLYAELQDKQFHNYDEAQKNYWNAINLSKNNYQLAQTYNNLALCYDKQKNYDYALKCATISVEKASTLLQKDFNYQNVNLMLSNKQSFSFIKYKKDNDIEDFKKNVMDIKSYLNTLQNDNTTINDIKDWIKNWFKYLDDILSKINQ